MERGRKVVHRKAERQQEIKKKEDGRKDGDDEWNVNDKQVETENVL
jgi:hypothetical protein